MPGRASRSELANSGHTRKRLPLDTAINRYWIPSIRAGIELAANNPAKAVEILKVALPYELGNPLPQPEIGALQYPVYLRGQAYLQLGQGNQAAAEFQRFLDHRGIVMNCPLGSLAQLGLARAYALSGNNGKAMGEYRGFFGPNGKMPRLRPARAAPSSLRLPAADRSGPVGVQIFGWRGARNLPFHNVAM